MKIYIIILKSKLFIDYNSAEKKEFSSEEQQRLKGCYRSEHRTGAPAAAESVFRQLKFIDEVE